MHSNPLSADRFAALFGRRAAVFALRADLRLRPAAATLVAPAGRLLEQPHAPPSEALDSAREARHKGLAKPPPKALNAEGPGVTPVKRTRAFVFSGLPWLEHNGTAEAEHRPRKSRSTLRQTAGAGFFQYTD